jgi:polysaccharide export outer membrane protein
MSSFLFALLASWTNVAVAQSQQLTQPLPQPAAPVAGQTPLATATSAPSASKGQSTASDPTAAKLSEDGRYRIGPGDLLEVRIFNRPQLSLESVRVDGRGKIRLPLIESDVQAACRTENELAQEIATLYREYQRNPQAFVFVKDYNSQPVAVIGAVEKPGRIQLQRRVRLLELLSFVGGPSDKAGLRVHITHAGNVAACNADGSLVAGEKSAEDLDVFTLSDTLMGDSQSNPYIRPGDIVSIPEAEQIFVVGNVYKPSAMPLKVPIRFSEAIAMAGGALPDSNLEQIRLVRQVPGTPVKQEQFINLRKINQRKAEDLMLLAGDIVEVPTLTGRKLARSLLTAMGPALVNLPLLILR